MQPLVAILTVYLPPSDQEQAIFTCGETANMPHRISILAVQAVAVVSRPIYIGFINL